MRWERSPTTPPILKCPPALSELPSALGPVELKKQRGHFRIGGVHSFGIVFDRQSFSARHRSMSQLLRTV